MTTTYDWIKLFYLNFSGKSILYELGGKQSWMHPNEFQAISGRETAKDWKRSIRHHGKSLKALMSKSVIIHHQNECECEWCLKNIAFFAKQHVVRFCFLIYFIGNFFVVGYKSLWLSILFWWNLKIFGINYYHLKLSVKKLI